MASRIPRERTRGRRLLRHALQALGIAGLAGVAATGVLVVRDQRRRAVLTPEEVRERLRARYAEAEHPQRAEPQVTDS